MKISKIKIGKRFRKELGDLETLKNSIKEIGLLQPIVIDENDNLIAGQRRLIACKELEMADIKVNQIKIKNALRGEYDENVIRKQFLPTEMVAIKKAIEPFKKKEAEKRMKSGRPSSKLDEGRTDEKIAKGFDIGKTTLNKAEQVVDFGDKELIKKMDDTNNVDRVYQEVKRQERQKEILKNIPKMPTGKYRVFLADPPWCYGNSGLDEYGHAERHYPTMKLQEICDMPIQKITEENAVLFLWATSPLLEDAFKVINAWGFNYKTSFVWDKIKHNFGYYNSVRHELLLIATKRSCLPDNRKLIDSVQSIERTKHSKKPKEFRNIIDKLYLHGKKIELFAREEIKGWDNFGNQIKK